MFEIHNKNFLNNKQRFMYAIVIGIITSISCAFIIAFLSTLLHNLYSIFYIGIALIISEIIKRFGRGVQKRFYILSIILTIFAILLTILLFCSNFSFFFHPQLIITILSSIIELSDSPIIFLICIAISVYIAYQNSRIV